MLPVLLFFNKIWAYYIVPVWWETPEPFKNFIRSHIKMMQLRNTAYRYHTQLKKIFLYDNDRYTIPNVVQKFETA
jgi:hypothetical protein